MSKQIGIDCARRRCLALAEANSYYCAAHRGGRITNTLCGDDAPDWSLGRLQRVTDRIEYERADGTRAHPAHVTGE